MSKVHKETPFYIKNPSESSVIIYHHLGLGDHIMCHGIVRDYCGRYKKVAIFCHPHNYPSVSFMYRDLSNLKIFLGGDNFARNFIDANNKIDTKEKYDEVKIIGFENLEKKSGVSLERQFYNLANVDFDKKWSNFYIKRDLEREMSISDIVKLDEKYIFIHQDLSRNFIINEKAINNSFKRIEPNKKLSENIFDYCYIIEKAEEIHVIDSSFMFLVEHLKYINSKQKLYIHRYARENSRWKLPVLKKNWIIINWYDTQSLVRYLVKSLYDKLKPIFFIIKKYTLTKKIIGNRALFLDRDGIICEAMEHGVDVTKPEEFVLMDGIKDVIKTAKSMGYLVVVVTNQSAISKGTLTEENLSQIHTKMQDLLENNVDKIYYCPHSKTDGCNCRKPKPGMLLRAIDELHIDPQKSIMVGDKESDVLAGQAVGCKTIFLDSPIHRHCLSECSPNIVIKNLSELLMVL